MKKFTAIILLIIFITACSSNETPADTSAGETFIEEESLDGLPALDYSGYEFNIYTRSNNTFYKYVIEEETGDILNDAVYRRTRNVEARLNVIFNEFENTDANAPRTIMLAGDDIYDMYNARCTHAFAFWLEGLTVEISDLPYIDLDKPYWNKTTNESLTLNKRQYVAIGAANIGAYDFIFTLLFNKKLINDLAFDSPYDLISSGKWTMDKMDEMMREASSDLNGDGKFDINDRYGYASGQHITLPAFWIGAGLFSVSKDSDDVPYLSAGDEKFVEVFNKVFDMTKNSDAWFKTPDAGNVPSTSITLLSGNQTLFMDTQVFDINRLRGMDTDFGIILYPKYDELQENYRVRFGFYDAFVVPKSNSELVLTSAVIEALNSESYETVMPVYYELCLKTRNSRDGESEAMLDLIFKNLVIDIGDTMWSDRIRDGVFTNMFLGNDRNIASKLASMANSIQSDIDKILDMK